MSHSFRIIVLLLLLLASVLTKEGVLVAQKENTARMPVQMTIPPSASLSLTGSDLRFSVKGKNIEQVITPSTVGQVWINYSSVIDNNSTNAISASLSSGDIPAEVVIKLKVGPDVGAGYGQMGIPTAPITLSPYPQVIISNIGTCYTGQGVNKGHQLTYTWELLSGYDDSLFTQDDNNELQVAVTYTITSSK